MQPISNGGTGITVGGLAAGPVTIGGTTPAARNVISANGTGIFLNPHNAGGSELVQGNFIGTNASGTGALPNLGAGVRMLVIATLWEARPAVRAISFRVMAATAS